jgi:hypothetical protein
MSAHVLLSEHKQTSRGHWQIDAIDPLRKSGPSGFGTAIAARLTSRYVRFMRHEWPWFEPGTH